MNSGRKKKREWQKRHNRKQYEKPGRIRDPAFCNKQKGEYMKTAIVTDSNSGIFEKEGIKLGVSVLPMPVIIEGRTYYEGRNLDHETFYRYLTEHKQVSSSQPALEDVKKMWDRLFQDGYDEILHIPMSSGLSGAFQSANMLAGEYDGKVQVVDNHRISVTQRHSVLDAVSLRERGCTAKEMKELLEQNAYESIVFIGVETLEYLKKGGRVTPAGAAMGEILNIKPLLVIKGEKLDAFAKVRGSKRCKKRELQEMKKIADEYHRQGKRIRVGVAGSFADKDAEQEWKDMAFEMFEGEDAGYDPLSFSVSCHVGPGAFGMGISAAL